MVFYLFSPFIITAILETIFLFIRYNATVPRKAKSIYTFVVLIINSLIILFNAAPTPRLTRAF